MAGTEIASLYASVGADTSKFDKAMGKTDSIIGKAGSALKSLVTGGVGLAVKGFTTAEKSIAGFVSDASDLNETVSKVGVVFGASGKDILKWADNSATA